MTRKLLFSTVFLCLFIILDTRAQAPVAAFTASPTSGCGPLSVTFTDQSTNTPLYWEWDFGNGQTSSRQNPVCTYGTAGTYTVTLIAKNASGADAIRKTDYITVYPYPSPAFTVNYTLACAPALIQFTDQSTPGQGSIAQWAWTFGDGSTSSAQNPSHSYTQTGYYNIGLKVTNSAGCSNSANLSRYIRIVPGVQPNFAWNQTSAACSAPFDVSFLNQTAGPGNLSYSWTLGNGNSSTLTNPTTVYPSNTSYTVTLTASSDLGCSASTQQVVSFGNASAKITGPDSACINTPVSFTDGSTPTPSSLSWALGDGTTFLNQSSVSHTYTTTGTYSIKLVNNYSTCVDSVVQPLVIVDTPVAAFIATTPTAGCKAPFTVSFQDKTTPGATSWSWNFGDGTTSNLQNPTHTYTSVDTFDVTLTASSSVGCSSTVTQKQFVTITPPTMQLSGVSAEGCVNTAISPRAIIVAPDGIATYLWSAPAANAPNTSTSPNPSFIFPNPGSPTLTLTITTNGGCSLTQSFTLSVGTPVIPSFTSAPSPVCGNHAVTFTAGPFVADSLIWNFGDDSTGGDSTVIHHSYHKTGTFNAVLTDFHGGCATSTTRPVTVSPPIDSIGYTVTCGTTNVKFSDFSQVNGTLLPISYTWKFGDGSPDVTVSDPPTAYPFATQTHPYPAFNTPYQDTLIIQNGVCTDTTTIRVIIPQLQVAIITPQTQVCVNKNFVVEGVIQPNDTSLVKFWSWMIGTNNPIIAGQNDTTSVPTVSQTPIPINLTVTDINNCTYQAITSYIQIIGPIAKYGAPAGGCVNSLITFSDSSQPYSASEPITTWNWDFGDGNRTNIFNGPPFSHTYADTGEYRVILTVEDSKGCTAAYANTIPVLITSPHAAFAPPDTLYCPNVPVSFIDSSQGDSLTDSWNFGDGSPASASPTHIYTTNSQTYTVHLTVTDKVGCSNSTTRPIHIQTPIASFSISDTTAICTFLQTFFIPQGQYYDSLYWNFGDGTYSTLDTTSHFYNSYDTFYAKLVLQGPGGCQDSATRRVFVLNPNLTTQFTYNPVKNCDSVLTNFTIVPPGWTLFTLNFGDGAADSSQSTSVSHMYRNPDSYPPSLTLTDSTGCIVGIAGTPSIQVLGAVPFFNMNPNAFCDSGTVNFTDFTISNDGISTETYLFGDGSSASQTNTPFNTSHFYNTSGILLPTLKVVTGSLCTESFTDTLKVYQTPQPAISISSLPCAGPIQFNGTLTKPDPDSVSWAWTFSNGQSSTSQNPYLTFAPSTVTATLRAYINFGCSDTISQNFPISPLPIIKGPKEITTPVGTPVTLPLTYSNDVITSYSWVPTNNINCTDCPNPTVTLTYSTEYWVTVTDSNNCSASDSILVRTICNDKNYFLPNTFSPNGDGVNDVFYPRGSNLYNIQSMSIFNRWGQKVFERKNFPANSASEGWDGTFNGRPAPSDVYVYVVEVICNNAQVVALRGDVTLIR